MEIDDRHPRVEAGGPVRSQSRKEAAVGKNRVGTLIMEGGECAPICLGG